MISIIIAVYNQLPMNKIFLEYLERYTNSDYELIIVDNGSTDGSSEFFESRGAKVLKNNGNFSYPYSQNRGIEIAKGDIYMFLNNDIIVSPNWDKRLIEILEKNELDIITSCGIEKLENIEVTNKFKRRWKTIKNIIGLFGYTEKNLRLMHKLMYINWEKFNDIRYDKYQNKVIEGFVGNTVIITKNGIEKIGLWDERIQAADFDLYMRSKKRYFEVGDIKPVHIALGVFNHHYIRLTSKQSYPEFVDKSNLISLEDKWGEKLIESYIENI